jgi:hypothetical protein
MKCCSHFVYRQQPLRTLAVGIRVFADCNVQASLDCHLNAKVYSKVR